jgi:hypothetical protein
MRGLLKAGLLLAPALVPALSIVDDEPYRSTETERESADIHE